MTTAASDVARARSILDYARDHEQEMVAYLVELARLESPTDVPESQAPVQAVLADSLEGLGFAVRHRD